jgi:hypothetical protein
METEWVAVLKEAQWLAAATEAEWVTVLTEVNQGLLPRGAH